MKIFENDQFNNLQKIWMRLSISDGIRFGFGLMLGGYMAMWAAKGFIAFILFILGIQSSNDLLL